MAALSRVVGYSEAIVGLALPLIITYSQPGSAPSPHCTWCSPTFFTAKLRPLGYRHATSFHFLLVPPLPLWYVALSSNHYNGPSYSRIPFSPQVIAIISNAIICSAAAWNLPISQNAVFHSKGGRIDEKGHPSSHPLAAQSHIDAYMIFLGAFSLLVLISM